MPKQAGGSRTLTYMRSFNRACEHCLTACLHTCIVAAAKALRQITSSTVFTTSETAMNVGAGM